MSEQLDPEQAAGRVKKAVRDSNRFPVMAFTDAGGLPQSMGLPFAHMNRNLTLILFVPTAHPAAAAMRDQPWIEVRFHTQNHDCFAYFGGRALVKQSDSALEKLIKGYPFLESWVDGSKKQAFTLVQLATQIIGLELRTVGAPEVTTEHYRVQNGALLPVSTESLAELQKEGENRLDIVRRMITRNRGEMIHCIITNNFSGFSAYIAEGFAPPDGASGDDWINAQWKMYKSIEPGKQAYNWGMTSFEYKRDGSVESRFFLEILDGEKKSVFEHREIWTLESSEWKLFKVM